MELAGALADLIHETMTAEYHHLAVTAAQVHLVDLGTSLLAPFSDSAHDYASKVLERKGVRLHLGVAVTEVGPGHVTLADGTTIPTRCVVWGGGIMAPGAAAGDGLPHGRGGRVDVQPDLSVEGLPGVYVVGRRRQHPRRRTDRASRSSARSPCRAVRGPPTTSSPSAPASRPSPSTTTTRASWR